MTVPVRRWGRKGVPKAGDQWDDLSGQDTVCAVDDGRHSILDGRDTFVAKQEGGHGLEAVNVVARDVERRACAGLPRTQTRTGLGSCVLLDRRHVGVRGKSPNWNNVDSALLVLSASGTPRMGRSLTLNTRACSASKTVLGCARISPHLVVATRLKKPTGVVEGCFRIR